jgi:proton-dependent oligopeptide transporter, POT family
LYIKDYLSKDAPFEIIQSAGAWSIIALQLVVNRMTRHLSPQTAIVAGFATSSLCWLIFAMSPSVWTAVAGIVVLAIGEMTQAPRYYEYISDLAPKGQQGLFQGYAFLPIAIAWIIGGPLGGWLYQVFAIQQKYPNVVWYSLFAVGVAATVLMSIYNAVVTRSEQAA